MSAGSQPRLRLYVAPVTRHGLQRESRPQLGSIPLPCGFVAVVVAVPSSCRGVFATTPEQALRSKA